MTLNLIVKHPNDNNGAFSNEWSKNNNFILDSITTTKKIKDETELAQNSKIPIHIYRCQYGANPAVISCSVEISSIQSISTTSFLIRFTRQQQINAEPPFQATQGMSYLYL